jgi:hypothetical protein
MAPHSPNSESTLNRRTKVIWFPACPALLVAGAWFVLTFRTPWMFYWLNHLLRIRFDTEHAWVYLLAAMVPLALAGTLAAGLSWRFGGHRWERLVAAEIPLGMFCISQFYGLWRSGSLAHVQTSLLVKGILLFAGYLLAGALPFLLPGDRTVPSGNAPATRSGG